MGIKPPPMTPVSQKMVIKHTLSWKALDYLNDASLLPQLRDKGMPVSLVMKDGSVRIAPDYGRFFWEDNGMYRTFIWEGVNKISEEEAARKLQELKEKHEAQMLADKKKADEEKERKFLNDLQPPRAINIDNED